MADSRSGAARLAVGVGVGLVALGLWAMVDPESFFDRVALFEPYNQHFLQDLGALQIGLGAVLLLAGLIPSLDALTVALVGVGIGGALHAFARDRNRSGWQAGHRHRFSEALPSPPW